MLISKNKIYVIATLLLGNCIAGCNNHGQSGAEIIKPTDSIESRQKPADTAAGIKPTDSAEIHAFTPKADTVDAGEADTLIQLKQGEAFIKGHLSANKIRPTYTLTANKGQTVIATIKPVQKGGNVRINQIQQPGGAFDGPFGDSLSYTFKKSGKLRFLIGENMMAGDPFTGDFILRVRLVE